MKLIELTKYMQEIDFVEIGIDKDHLHLHMVIPPKYSVRGGGKQNEKQYW